MKILSIKPHCRIYTPLTPPVHHKKTQLFLPNICTSETTKKSDLLVKVAHKVLYIKQRLLCKLNYSTSSSVHVSYEERYKTQNGLLYADVNDSL